MPRKKATGVGYADKGRGFAEPAGVLGEAVGGGGVEVLLSPPQAESSAADALKAISLYDEGWLRIVSHEMGKTVYYKFKFSKGRHAGGYVFYRQDDLDPTRSLWGLLGKIEGVYAGTHKTTPDHAYE